MKRKTHQIVVSLREARRSRNMTQRDLAKMIGVCNEAVSQWETGAREPSIFMFECWAESLGMKITIVEK